MTCPTGKRCYTSPRLAKAAHCQCSWRLRVYLCEWCLRYHVTNHEKSSEATK